ncbi:type II/IV secretion system ATPase subunit [Candidatus Bathyarchaeota archaeon]|nr:type II/IV secretion system ATPase subunit [Candidatus Bathyarchaeota archaeon]
MSASTNSKSGFRRKKTKRGSAQKPATIIQPSSLHKDLIMLKDYPLNEPFAHAVIVRNKIRGTLTYLVREPLLDEDEQIHLQHLKELLLEVLDVGLQELESKEEAKAYLEKKSRKLLKQHFKISDTSKEKLLYYVIRDNYGFGKIDPLMHDPLIEDISCDGPETNLYIWHRDFESIPTNVHFESSKELDSFALRLAYLCGRHISIAQPMLDSSLPDGSRLHLTYGKEITRKGSTLTIRKFRVDPLTIVDLVRFTTLTPEIGAYLWYAVENRVSTLVCGGIASGKTTMLNCLSMFIKPDLKIVSIEDTPELNLPHENWVPTNTRTHFGLGTEKADITLFDLLKASLRQRPDYIIVGEVRGHEAYTLFQAVSTGHLGMSTLHAESVKAAVYRLESEPMNIPRTLISGLDVILVQRRVKAKEGSRRKTIQVSEIVGLDPRSREILTNEVFRWNAVNDAFEYTGRSYLVERIAARAGKSLEDANKEIQRRAKVLEWMTSRNIRNFNDVSDVIRRYYEQPERVSLEATKG